MFLFFFFIIFFFLLLHYLVASCRIFLGLYVAFLLDHRFESQVAKLSQESIGGHGSSNEHPTQTAKSIECNLLVMVLVLVLVLWVLHAYMHNEANI